MEVQHSDSVVSEGRLYRVQAQPDGTRYTSLTQPTHPAGVEVHESIPWGVVQADAVYTAGVRNVVFRDIFLRNLRTSFSVHFDNDRYIRSYYPGAPVPVQEQFAFENVRVLHGGEAPLLFIGTPVDAVMLQNSRLGQGGIVFRGNGAMRDYGRTTVALTGCVFNAQGDMALLDNRVAGKRIALTVSGCVATHDDFQPHVTAGDGSVAVDGLAPTGSSRSCPALRGWP